jgi:CheY-like chemotaxis protein
VLARAVEMVSPLLEERGHQLSVHVDEDLRVQGDAVRLSQVFGNLLTNAGRYTPPGGHIALRACREGASARVEVEDDGIGIASDELRKIFEPFVQSTHHAKATQGGLGLGLSLVNDLVKLHGGSVEAHSDGVGRGSRFVVRLPLSAGDIAAAAPPLPVAPALAKQRVLVVDDNEDAAEMLTLWLEERGYEVRVAHDGPRALEASAAFQPNAAVVDLGLPVMDGFELAERLGQQHGAGVRLIALTGYGQPQDREKTRRAGFAAHLVKPVELSELEHALAAET